MALVLNDRQNTGVFVAREVSDVHLNIKAKLGKAVKLKEKVGDSCIPLKRSNILMNVIFSSFVSTPYLHTFLSERIKKTRWGRPR